TYIQRVNTVGGKAPTAPGDVGEVVRVPYTAEYFFYRADHDSMVAADSGGLTSNPGNDNRAPDLGDFPNLQVPAGNKVTFHAYAEGVQIYRWDGTKWVFVAPEATLYADAGHHGVIGTHYAGPTWESVSGSHVVGTVLARATADPNAIPWLLLKAKSSDGPGIFDDVTYI